VTSTCTISLAVDADAARAFAEASLDDRRKLELLLSLRLQELTTRPTRTLREIMDDVGQRAAALGMTSERLDSILQDE
jgi:hypothetical protein